MVVLLAGGFHHGGNTGSAMGGGGLLQVVKLSWRAHPSWLFSSLCKKKITTVLVVVQKKITTGASKISLDNIAELFAAVVTVIITNCLGHAHCTLLWRMKVEVKRMQQQEQQS